MKRFMIILAALLASVHAAGAEDAPSRSRIQDITKVDNKEGPKTKLEAFIGNVGVVTIKGYVEVGSMSSYTDPIRVIAMTMHDEKTGKETSGALFEIFEITGAKWIHAELLKRVDKAQSYVDADELADLLSGLTFISQANDTVTPMRFYEAQYSTRGGLELTVYNNAQGQRLFLVHVGGTLTGKDAFLDIQDLPNFWDLVTKAKEVIENPQRLGKMQSSTVPGATQSTAPVSARPKSTGKN